MSVRYHTTYKTVALIYKALKGDAMHYITEKLKWKKMDHRYYTQTACDTYILEMPKVKKKAHVTRSFSVMGPELWNALSLDMRRAVSLTAFKKKLKTELFRKAYNMH